MYSGKLIIILLVVILCFFIGCKKSEPETNDASGEIKAITPSEEVSTEDADRAREEITEENMEEELKKIEEEMAGEVGI